MVFGVSIRQEFPVLTPKTWKKLFFYGKIAGRNRGFELKMHAFPDSAKCYSHLSLNGFYR